MFRPSGADLSGRVSLATWGASRRVVRTGVRGADLFVRPKNLGAAALRRRCCDKRQRHKERVAESRPEVKEPVGGGLQVFASRQHRTRRQAPMNDDRADQGEDQR